MNLLALSHISKTFGSHKAVEDVSFEVPQGAIFGLLGPNGAGKTTIIRIITSILAADSGQLFFEDQPMQRQHQHLIGYMPEERGLYKKMRVGELLVYLGRLKGLSAADTRKRVKDWMNKFDIGDWWGKKIEELSKGMQQKVQFIATILHEPRLLILDEPFSGLDPVNTNLIKREIHDLRDKGATIIFSTHRMEQVEEICEQIALINKGRKVLEGEVAAVKQQFKENKYRVEYEGDHAPTLNGAFEVLENAPGKMVVKLQAAADSKTLLRQLISEDVHLTTFHEILPTLNEIFIHQVAD